MRRRDVWQCVRCATQDDGGISRLFKKFTVRKIVPGNFRRRREMMLHMSCARQDASRDRIGVAGILMNDGHGCGSHKKF